MLNVYKVKVVFDQSCWMDDIVVASNIKDAAQLQRMITSKKCVLSMVVIL